MGESLLPWRRLLLDYAPNAWVVVEHHGQLEKTEARNLFMEPYSSYFDEGG